MPALVSNLSSDQDIREPFPTLITMNNKEPPNGLTRKRPMKVLALGMGRTGTKSLAEGLRQLGFHTYDFLDRVHLRHLPAWTDSIRSKWHGEGPEWGRAQFDELFGDYDAILDTPCCFFVEELMAAYPDAKVVLTTRDPDKWLVSMQSTIFKSSDWWSWKILRYTDPGNAGVSRKYQMTLWGALCPEGRDKQARQVFIDHMAYVQRVVPPEKLLVYKVQDGWGPLCEFLGLPEPDTPFPCINDSKAIVALFKTFWWACVRRSVMNVSGLVLGAAAVAYGSRRALRMFGIV